MKNILKQKEYSDNLNERELELQTSEITSAEEIWLKEEHALIMQDMNYVKFVKSIQRRERVVKV